MDVKPSVEEKLNRVLGIEESELNALEPINKDTTVVVSSGNPERDFDSDFNTVRSVLHSHMHSTKESSEAATYIAKEKQDAKTIEAATLAQKEHRESALSIIALWQKKADIETTGQKTSGDQITQNNAVFIGTTGELLKLTKDLKAGYMDEALKSITAIDIKPEEDGSK
jgi:hypothetical protein